MSVGKLPLAFLVEDFGIPSAVGSVGLLSWLGRRTSSYDRFFSGDAVQVANRAFSGEPFNLRADQARADKVLDEERSKPRPNCLFGGVLPAQLQESVIVSAPSTGGKEEEQDKGYPAHKQNLQDASYTTSRLRAGI